MITPASASAARVAGGSASSQETSVVSARGATTRPRSREPLGEVGGERGGAAVHLGPAVALERLDRGEREGDDLAGERRRVVAGGLVLERRVEAGRRAREAHVARRDRAQLGAERGGEVEHAGAVGAAQPLLAGGGVGGAVQRGHVERDRAGALGAVEHHRHVDLGERRRGDLAADPGDVRAGDEPGPRARPRRRRRAARPSARPRRGRARPCSGPSRPGCSWSEVTISSPGPRSIPARTVPMPSLVPVASATSAGVGAEHARVGLAQAAVVGLAGLEVGRPAAAGELVLERRAGRVGRRRRHRPVRARVEIRERLQDGELGAEGGGVHAARGQATGRRRARALSPAGRTAAPPGRPARPRTRRRGCPCRRPTPRSTA